MTPTKLTVLAVLVCAFAARAVEFPAALAWYDSLGYPDVAKLPYIHVATGLWTQTRNETPVNRYVNGFLLSEDAESFTVFISSVPSNPDWFREDAQPQLTTVRFVRKSEGLVYERVSYEKVDFKKAASEALNHARAVLRQQDTEGAPAGYRSRVFAFGRACQQKELPEIATPLIEVAASLRDYHTEKIEPAKLRELLQMEMGEAVLEQTEEAFGYPAAPWAEQLKIYEHFETRYPACPRIAYAREAAEVLRKMIAEETAHHPKPLAEMSLAEQVAEEIYQVRYLKEAFWTMEGRYPIVVRKENGKPVKTPVHRLIDLGPVAVPPLIVALDDRRFTRCMEMQFNGLSRPKVMRVADVVEKILESVAGRSFVVDRTEKGEPAGPTSRQQAEAWWAEVQGKGEKESLIKATAAGGQPGSQAARTLVEKYPEAALEAIREGIRATARDGERRDFVEVAAKIPGDASMAFLREWLALTDGLYSQLAAAEGLFDRGDASAVPAMITAWRKIQPRLPKNERDAWWEVGGVIGFLARSGDAAAIDALREESAHDPVEVRLAIVETFLLRPFSGDSLGESVSSSFMHHPEGIEKLPGGAAGAAIEHLLVAALDDTVRRKNMEGFEGKVSFKDPRICDMAAYVFSIRWPDKYQFQWTGDAAACDAQIAKIRDRWRAEKPRGGSEGEGESGK